MDALRSVYFAGVHPGSNTEVLSDYVMSTKYGAGVTYDPSKAPFDLAFTNNGRLIEGVRARLKINTQHGNLFLGDTKPEPQYGIKLALAASESEKSMMVRNGFRPENVLVTGQPRTDRLWRLRSDADEIRTEHLKSKNLSPLKPTILYAPTYSRGAFGMGEKLFFASSLNVTHDAYDVQDFVRICEEAEFNVIVRLHKYQKRFFGQLVPPWLLNLLSGVEIHDNESDPDSIPALLSADVLITDYSSITADFMALEKPIVFVQPHPGWKYSDAWHARPHERVLMGRVASSGAEIARAATDLSWFKDGKDNRRSMLQKYQPLFDGKCCQRVWEEVLSRG